MTGLDKSIADWIVACATGLGVVYVFLGFEDLFLDIVAYWNRLKPQILSPLQLASLAQLPQKKIAILVPAWKEGKIIGDMLRGNLQQIRYFNYRIFVGCYPNDPETVAAVKQVGLFNSKVVPIINGRSGPTSKGQMLNEILVQIRSSPEHQDIDAFLLQDSEDVIDPWALQIVNERLGEGLGQFDFVQLPVFSLSVRMKDWVAGTYMDEFAELHTKDLFVREFLGAAIPSAGVGTAFSARLSEKLYQHHGCVFPENSVTEDYELGMRSFALKARATFACYGFKDTTTGLVHYIATREYFPKKWVRSIRQKTRWTVGIAIQGWRNLGWKGPWSQKYFLLRDRRSLISPILAMAGYPISILLVIFLNLCPANAISDGSVRSESLGLLLGLNGVLVLNRFLQRIRCVHRVYGVKAVLPLLIRWPIAVVINSLASLNAIRQAIHTQVNKRPMPWVKTEHELPIGFGHAGTTSIHLSTVERNAG